MQLLDDFLSHNIGNKIMRKENAQMNIDRFKAEIEIIKNGNDRPNITRDFYDQLSPLQAGFLMRELLLKKGKVSD